MFKKLIILSIIVIFLGSLFLCPPGISTPGSDNIPRLGIWITTFSPENVLHSRENADLLIRTCRESGIKDVYLQVYRADKAYYDSDITDRTAYETISAGSKEDILSYLIKKAKKNDINVYAWMNLLSIAQNKNANILKMFGEDILTLDQHGRTPLKGKNKDVLDKYYIRENQLFLEPGDPRVRSYLSNIAGEIIKKYPDLSGIHLDYVRYPAAVPFIPGSRFTSHGISYGYSAQNIKNFSDSTGINVNDLSRNRKNFGIWDRWRRDQVTALVRKISDRVRSVSPGMKISCTIVPSVERTYLVTLQDWTYWLEENYIDYVVAMNYTTDTRIMELNSDALLSMHLSRDIHIGVGAFLLKEDPDVLEDQLSILHKLAPAGIVIFSYDDIARDKDLQEFLIKNFD